MGHTSTDAVARSMLTYEGGQLRRNAKDHVVEIRKLAKNYLQFIKGSQRFYRQYILNLDAQFDGIPELRKIAQKWKDDSMCNPFRYISLTHCVQLPRRPCASASPPP